MSWLNHYTVLQISGPDAERFLQGQFTNNLSELADGSASLSACCNAKGRMVANFVIARLKDVYWLVLPADSAALLAQHLQKYKVFFKADIHDLSDEYQVFANTETGQAGTLETTEHYTRIQLAEQVAVVICQRAHAQSTQLPPQSSPLNWQLQRMKAGIHFVNADQTEQWIPQQINWHSLAGVSFNKGCYTGQEIIARMQFLGKSKKALGLYQSDTQTDSKQLFDSNGKALAQVLESQTADTGETLILAVVSADILPDHLFADQNGQFSLTLQNLPYTVEKTE